jgi:hypothetical protein
VGVHPSVIRGTNRLKPRPCSFAGSALNGSHRKGNKLKALKMLWTAGAVLLACLQYMVTPAAAQSTPTPTPGASASPVASFQQTGPGFEVPAGFLGLTNITTLTETVSQVSIQISSPPVYSTMTLIAQFPGGAQQNAVTGALEAVTVFSFSPALTVPAGTTIELGLTAVTSTTATSAGRAARLAGWVVDLGSRNGRSGLMLAAGLLLGVLLIGWPALPRRRTAIIGVLLLAFVATQVACNSGSTSGPSGPVIGSSLQQIPDGGISVSDSNGAVGVQGLPALIGSVQLLEFP